MEAILFNVMLHRVTPDVDTKRFLRTFTISKSILKVVVE